MIKQYPGAQSHGMTRRLFLFFTLTFGVTWLSWTLATAMSTAIVTPLFYLGTFAPAIVALALTRHVDGRAATEDLLMRVIKWDVDARWYVFAIGFMPAIKLTVAVVHRIATGVWPRFGHEQWYVIAGAIVVSTFVQAGEEIGWRGFALPRLSDSIGLAPASLILGFIWAAWHLPLFFVPVSDTYGQSFLLFLLQVTALSVAMAWLYWRSAGSLFLVMVLHAAVNNTKDIVPSAVRGAMNVFVPSASLVGWLTVALLWIVASYLLGRMPAGRSPASER